MRLTHYDERHLSKFARYCNCIVTSTSFWWMCFVKHAVVPPNAPHTWCHFSPQGLNSSSLFRLPCVAHPDASAEQSLDAKPVDQKQDLIFPPPDDPWMLESCEIHERAPNPGQAACGPWQTQTYRGNLFGYRLGEEGLLFLCCCGNMQRFYTKTQQMLCVI